MPAAAAPQQAQRQWAKRYKYGSLQRTPTPVLLMARQLLQQHGIAGINIPHVTTLREQRKITKDINSAIRHRLQRRRNGHAPGIKSNKKRKKGPMFVTSFTSPAENDIDYEAVISSSKSINLLPPETRELWHYPVIAHFYEPFLSTLICNYSSIATKTTPGNIAQAHAREAAGQLCPCHKHIYDGHRDNSTGHVNTSSMDIVRQRQLRTIMKKGAKYRATGETDRGDIIQHGVDGVKQFATRFANFHGVTLPDAWITSVRDDLFDIACDIDAVDDQHGGIAAFDIITAGPEAPISFRARGALRQLQRNFVITTADKNPHAYAVVCKRHYLNGMTGELDNGNTYNRSNKTEEDVEAEWNDFYDNNEMLEQRMKPHQRLQQDEEGEQINVDHTEGVPTGFMTIKYHKQPISQRFIASAGSASSTRLSQNINIALKALLPDAHAEWRRTLLPLTTNRYGTGSKQQRRRNIHLQEATARSWITTESTQAREMLSRLNRDVNQRYNWYYLDETQRCRRRGHQRRCVRAARTGNFRSKAIHGVFDFSTMYTALPHDHPVHGLKQRMANLFIRFFNRHEDGYLIINHDEEEVRWQKGVRTVDNNGNVTLQPPTVDHNSYALDSPTLIQWMNQLVDNCFLLFGTDIIWRQVVGLPMGEACSGMLANLFLYSYELEFMEKLMARRMYATAQKFLYTVRYIDDVGTYNNREFKSRRYIEEAKDNIGIYPKQFLTLKEERKPAHSPGGRLLDLFIHTDDNSCTYVCNAITESQDNRPKRDPKYPTNDTLLADRSKYGIVLGEGTRFRRLCTQWSVYTELCGDMMYAMYRHGYDMCKVRRMLRRTTATTMFHYNKTTGDSYHAALRRLRARIDGAP